MKQNQTLRGDDNVLATDQGRRVETDTQRL